MTVLVLGGSGATGRLLVDELLGRGRQVRALVRSPERMPEALRAEGRVELVRGSISDLSDADVADLVRGCTAVASCLGHTMSFRGIYGRPRRLVTDAVRRTCQAIRATGPAAPTRFVLMNTAGNSNRDLREPVSMAQKAIIQLLRLLLPPHADNEEAADHLRNAIGQRDAAIEWVVVRPDTLVNEAEGTDYVVHPSPTRSALFDPGVTSRINVARFMADLIAQDDLWTRWRGRMPVIYNVGGRKSSRDQASGAPPSPSGGMRST